MKKQKAIDFTKFTKRRKVTKALRMELIPKGRTFQTIEEYGLLKKDDEFQKNLSAFAPFIDLAVRKIADNALSNISFDFAVFYEETDVKKKGKLEKSLRSEIAASVKEALPEGVSTVTQINSAKFIQAVPSYIEASSLPPEEKAKGLSLCDYMDRKALLMNRFFVSRITALNTWMPDRVLENFGRYCTNMEKIQKILQTGSLSSLAGIYPLLSGCTDPGKYGGFLTQDGINAYNQMLTGIYEGEKQKDVGVNQAVNEYNQRARGESPSLAAPEILYKQILMPAEKKFETESISSDEDIRKLLKEIKEDPAKQVIESLEGFTPEDIVVCKNRLHALSSIVYGSHHTLPDYVSDKEKEEKNGKTAGKRGDRKTAKKEYTFKALNEIADSDLFSAYKTGLSRVFIEAAAAYGKVEKAGILKEGTAIKGNQANVQTVKDYFDAWTELRRCLQVIHRNTDEKGDNAFYNLYDEKMQDISGTWKAENLIRNYVTKKTGEAANTQETLLGSIGRKAAQWWNEGKDLTCGVNLIYKDEAEGKYYFYVMLPGAKLDPEGTDGDILLMSQNKAQKAYQMLPKMTFCVAKKFFKDNPDALACVIDKKCSMPVTVSREAYHIYAGKHYTAAALKDGTVSEDEYKKNVLTVLSVYKEFMQAYSGWECFDIRIRDLADYANVNEFFEDVDRCTYGVTWETGNRQALDEAVSAGTALKFEIHSQGLYNGRPKGYGTLFLKMMDPDGDGSLRLNSRPSLFFRKAVIKKKDRVIHKKGSILVGRIDTDGKHIPDDIYLELSDYYNSRGNFPSDEAMEYVKHGKVKTRKAAYDIIKDKKYTQDKFFIQFTYTKNADVSEKNDIKKFNEYFREAAKTGNIMAVTRSEDDILYYSVVNGDGNVLEEASLNEIEGTNYWNVLRNAGFQRRSEKKENWKYDRKVKDIRDGYLDLAIHVILEKMLRYQAVIALEFLSDRYKDKMSAFDNTAYKLFETKLLARLSDLHFKDIPDGEPGSVTNPFQLVTGSGNTFQDGIVFYAGTADIRTTDTETGFTQAFDFSGIHSAGTKIAFLSKFESIAYREDTNRFVFMFDYDNFLTAGPVNNTKWRICAGGPATIREKGRTIYKPEYADEIIKALKEDAVPEDTDLAKLALDGGMKAKTADILYTAFQKAVFGKVGMHMEKDKDSIKVHKAVYISPVSGKEYVFSAMKARNLALKMRHLVTAGKGQLPTA